MKPVPIEKLSVLSGYSVDWFTHYFRKSTGLSVAAFVRRHRLALAARELLGEVTPSQIASKYGFETHSGFSKAFNKYQHKRALALTARKLVRLVFRLLKDNRLYIPPESAKDRAASPNPCYNQKITRSAMLCKTSEAATA